jgi:hypothetical protein
MDARHGWRVGCCPNCGCGCDEVLIEAHDGGGSALPHPASRADGSLVVSLVPSVLKVVPGSKRGE